MRIVYRTILAREVSCPRETSQHNHFRRFASRLRCTADIGDARNAGTDHQPAEAERQASQHAPISLLARHCLRGHQTGMHPSTVYCTGIGAGAVSPL